MPHQVIVRSPPAHRRKRRGVGEVAGGSAAECAAVCCCCPCAVLHLVVLAVYKVPAGLVKKAARKRRRRLQKNNNVGPNQENDIVLLHPHRCSSAVASDFAVGSTRVEEFLAKEPEDEGLEKEMWARFAGTGFWRSESQRQP